MRHFNALPPTLLWLLAATALAAQPRQDLAIFFPVTDYAKGSGWDPLAKTLPECKAIAADLEQLYGFKTEVLPNQTKQQIEDKLYELSQRSFGPQDQLLLFFSMHGNFEEIAKGGSLIPYGGTQDRRTWLLHATLDYHVSVIPCPHIAIALDACYSGTFGGAKGIPNGPAGNGCADKIRNALQNKSRLYLTAGGKEKVPADSDFARKWRSALGTLGGEDGLLTFPELQARLSEATPTPKWGTFGDDLGGSFVLVPKNGCGGSAPPPTPARDPDGAAIENARRQNTEEAWQLYLDTWPRGRYRTEAEQALYRFQEDRVWRAAENAKTPAAYNNYKSIYCPGGQYCAEVEERLKTRTDNMVPIKGGTFQMGSNDGESDEKPVHTVTVSDFYLNKYEVTVEEYMAFVNSTNANHPEWLEGGSTYNINTGSDEHYKKLGSALQNPKSPVVGVSWENANAYCKWLSQKTGLSYRLPTEAEWEYAAGGGNGNRTKWAGTSDESNIKHYGNSNGDADGYTYTAPVGSFQPNVFGLYDMTGNVWEWCSDWKGTYPSAAQTNPTGPATGSYRVVRGGSWFNAPQDCRVANRNDGTPGDRLSDVGFRLARTK